MRRTVQKKLHSQRGASLLFAFLFLLVASMVSTVIIAGAVTAVRRAHDDIERQQSYLTLESASVLLRDMLKDTSVTITVSFEFDGETLTGPIYSYGYSGPLGEVMKQAIQELYEDADASERTLETKRTISVSAPEIENGIFQPVQMDFTLRQEPISAHDKMLYRINGILQLENEIPSGEEPEINQKLYLSALANHDDVSPVIPPETASGARETTYTVKWENITLYTRPERETETES